tara:strand:+ start:473 stop:1087 length:615 start_codon:yes stop_codon:yes gene_type:complete
VLFVLAACGDEQIGAAGQCGGAELTGICVTIDLISPGSVSLPQSDDVDAFQNPDCDGDRTTNDPEEFSRHSAEITLSVVNLISSNEPGITSGVPTFVTLTTYQIDYQETTDGGNEVPGPLMTAREFNETIRIDVETSQTVTLAFLEIAQLIEYSAQAIQDGIDDTILSYTATYSFSGEDSLGNPVFVEAFKKFQIGNFNTCSSE